jgi:hypothetical protein
MNQRQRFSVVDFLVIAPFAAGLAICMALILPVLWTTISGITLQPSPTYQRCGALKEDAARLDCYDRVRHEHLPQSAKEERRASDLFAAGSGA